MYFKRRDKNYPYENDGTSNLFEIKLSSEEKENRIKIKEELKEKGKNKIQEVKPLEVLVDENVKEIMTSLHSRDEKSKQKIITPQVTNKKYDYARYER